MTRVSLVILQIVKEKMLGKSCGKMDSIVIFLWFGFSGFELASKLDNSDKLEIPKAMIWKHGNEMPKLDSPSTQLKIPIKASAFCRPY